MEAGNMKRLVRTLVCIVLCMLVAGCSSGNPSLESGPVFQSIGAVEIPPSEEGVPAPPAESEIAEADWSRYFDGLNGSAVVYHAACGQYQIYNLESALIPRSPCSTFKIISSLTALEEGIIRPENSLREWSGEIFWKESWNGDIDFREAFRESCVWYFREIINEIGPERVKE